MSEEPKKNYTKYNLNDIKNRENYKDHLNIIDCSVCHHVSILPYFCKPCNISICQNCLYELKITNCLFCNVNKLIDASTNFSEFFKDLQIQCPSCQENILYPNLYAHNCSENNNNNLPQNNNNNPNSENDDIKYFDGVIHLLCKNCNNYIPNPLYSTHACASKYNENQQNIMNSPLANLSQNQNKDSSNNNINNFCSMFSGQKLNTIEENLLSKKYSELKIESRLNKLENILADFMSNFTKTFTTNPNVLDLTNSINNLNSNVIEMQKSNKFSFCFNCKTPKKLGDICPCSCKFCEKNKNFCLNCIIVCHNCNTLISKNCKFSCVICKSPKCPMCEEQKNVMCLCSENRICGPCHNFNLSNNPNLTMRNLLNSKDSHRNCKFVKSLSRNIFIAKFFDADFKLEIALNNNNTQIITLNLIKNKIDLNSKIMQLAQNDVLKICKIKDKIIFSTLDDLWEVNLIYFEEKKLDFVIFNFNSKPERLVLTKLETVEFDNLPDSNYDFGNMNANSNNMNFLQQNNEERNKIKWIYYEKI